MAKLLEGKAIAERIKQELKQKLEKAGKRLKLSCVAVGENPGAEVYMKAQKKTADMLGIEYDVHRLGNDATAQQLAERIGCLNSDASVNGIIVQLPLPAHLDYRRVSSLIAREKDVEGMNPSNLGALFFGQAKVLPCTAGAVMELVTASGTPLEGAETVIVGHSEIVGKPLSLLLLDRLATVTVCHIGTAKAGRLEDQVRRAQVLIVAVGKAGLIKGSWVKENAVVIDVGINKEGDRIVGDVEFEEAEKRASWITPVPGGVGPLTVAVLMRNLAAAAGIV